MPEINIDVFSKPGCDVCNRFKKRITDMGCTFTAYNANDYLEYSDDWREKKSYEVMAFLDYNDGHFPIIRVNGEYYTYAKAISKIKELQNEGQSAQGTIGGIVGVAQPA